MAQSRCVGRPDWPVRSIIGWACHLPDAYALHWPLSRLTKRLADRRHYGKHSFPTKNHNRHTSFRASFVRRKTLFGQFRCFYCVREPATAMLSKETLFKLRDFQSLNWLSGGSSGCLSNAALLAIVNQFLSLTFRLIFSSSFKILVKQRPRRRRPGRGR